jgi:hypothetical protein
MLSGTVDGKFAKSWISRGMECGLQGCRGVLVGTEWLFGCQNIVRLAPKELNENEEWKNQIRIVLANMKCLSGEESLEHLRMTLIEAVKSGSLRGRTDDLQYSLMIPIEPDTCRKVRVVCGSTSTVQSISMKNAFSVETRAHFYAEFDCIRCGEIRIGWSVFDSLCVHLGRTKSSVSIDQRGFLRNNDARHGPKMRRQWTQADTLGVSLEWDDSGIARMHWYVNGLELHFKPLENITHATSLYLMVTLNDHAIVDCVHPSCMQYCPDGCAPIQMCAPVDE